LAPRSHLPPNPKNTPPQKNKQQLKKVICSVISRPQLLAVLARVEDAAEAVGRSKQNAPGSSPWEVLDFGDVVVHVFTPEQRAHYAVEDFYAAADEVDLPFLAGRGGEGGGPLGGGSVGGGGRGGSGWSTTL
jgi:ribosomal silencing factor RsfS